MKFLYSLMIVTVLVSCNKETTDKHMINGNAPGVLNGMRVYYGKVGENGKQQFIDTAVVINEEFHFDPVDEVEKPEIRFLNVDGSNGSIVYLHDNNPVEVKVNKDSVFKSSVKGSKLNDQFNTYKAIQDEYRAESKTFNQQRSNFQRSGQLEELNQVIQQWQEEEKRYVSQSKNYISKNTNTLLGPIILGDLISSKLIDPIDARQEFNKFSADVQREELSIRIDDYLRKIESVGIGRKAPSFDGHNPDGKVIKLEEVIAKNKVTLIDFWASWCGPCRRENPNIVNAYQKYKNKGFGILGVSLDKPGAEEQWKQAIEKDNLTWDHISRLQYFGPIARQYNVNAIPAAFLLDENGVIVAKDLRGQQLHNKLEELLGS